MLPKLLMAIKHDVELEKGKWENIVPLAGAMTRQHGPDILEFTETKNRTQSPTTEAQPPNAKQDLPARQKPEEQW